MKLDKRLVDIWAEAVFIKWQKYMNHTPAEQVSITLPIGWVGDDNTPQYVDVFSNDDLDMFKKRVYGKLVFQGGDTMSPTELEIWEWMEDVFSEAIFRMYFAEPQGEKEIIPLPSEWGNTHCEIEIYLTDTVFKFRKRIQEKFGL